MFAPESVSVLVPPFVRDIDPEKTSGMLLEPFALSVTLAFDETLEVIATAPLSVTGVPFQPDDAIPVPVTLTAPVPAFTLKPPALYQTPLRPQERFRLIVPLTALVSRANVLAAPVVPASP